MRTKLKNKNNIIYILKTHSLDVTTITTKKTKTCPTIKGFLLENKL